VSPLPFGKIERYLHKYFSIQEKKTPGVNRLMYNAYTPSTKEVKKPIQQVHALLGVPAFDIYHKDRVGMFVLNQIVGGNAMISRLNLALREKAGMVYGVESNYTPFTDTGLFAVYFATDLKNVNKATNAVHRELKKLKEIGLGTRQLSSVKDRLCAQLAMAEENNSAVMQMMAKSVLDQGKVSDLEGVFSDIRDVSASNISDIANEIFDRDRFTQLTYIPENGNS
jgi:predicted Zn-dependent peptidase